MGKVRNVLVGLLLVSLLLASAGCGSQSGSTEAEPIKIGAIFDITGPASSLGVPERDTALLLEKQINEAGGINGHPVDLIIEDNESNETKSLQVAKKLVEVDKVAAIAGPSTTGTSMAIVDYLQKSEVPLVSAAAGVNIASPAEERKWVFKTAQNDSVVVDKVMDYLKSNSLTKVAFLSMNNAFGDSGRVEFEKAAQAQGITLVATEKFEATDKDMTSQLTRVKGASPQAVVIWAIPPSAAIVTKNFSQLGLNVPLIHSHGIGNQAFIDLAGPASEGVIFPCGRLLVAEQLPEGDPQKEVLVQYAQDYESAYQQPRSTFGGHGWDAVSIIFQAVEKAGTDRAAIRDAIESTTGFAGISGIFNFSPTDHSGLGKDALVMVTIKDGKWVVLE